MTAIAAPASVLPSTPASAGGYDKDAAEGFGALLANASASASNDKTSTRDGQIADSKAADRATAAKAADAKAADKAAGADASDKAAAKTADAAQAADKASGKTDDSKDQAAADAGVAKDSQAADATIGKADDAQTGAAQADAAQAAAAALIAAMQAPVVEAPKSVADADTAAPPPPVAGQAAAFTAVSAARDAALQPPEAVPAAALATDASATAPAVEPPQVPTASAADLAAAAAAASKLAKTATAPTAKAETAAPAPAAQATAAADAALATAAQATDQAAAEPAPAATPAAAAQLAAPQVASVTGKVVKAAEPKTPAVNAANTSVAAAGGDAEPVHAQAVQSAHAATSGEGQAQTDDQPASQGQALADAAPVVAAADASATAPTFVAQGTAAAPTPIVAAQLPKAGPETVSHLTTEIASKAVVGKTSRFDVVLQPEGLGRVDVRIEIAKDGKLTAALNFDNPAAAADLRGKSAELRQALAQAGFNVADNALSFDSSSQNSGQNQNAFFNFQDGENGRQAFQGRAFQSALAEDLPALSPSALLPGLRVAERSGVDVKI